MDNGLKVTNPNPRLSSNVFSKLTFWWMIGLFKKGRGGSLKVTDIYKPLPDDESEKLADKLEKYWEEEIVRAKKKDCQPNLLRVICRMFIARYMFLGFLTLIQFVVVRAYTPIVLSELIAMFSAQRNITDFEFYLNGALLVALSLLSVFFFHHISLEQNRIGMRVRIACSSLVYRKALKLNKKTSDQTTSGQVVNLLSNDVSRFDLLPMFLHWIWLTPVHVAVLTYLIWQKVGLASLAGTFTMFGMTIPLQGYFGKVTAVLRRKATTKTDSRIRKMLEIVTGIQIIKVYAWERPFEKIVEKLRASEIKVLRHLNFLKGVLLSFAVFMERTTLFVTVVCFVLLGNVITADKAFSIAQFFNGMQLSVAIFFPLAINISAETAVTLKRLEEFLALAEREKPAAQPAHSRSVTLEKVNASWGTETPTIKNLNLNIPPGALCAIVGPVGAGKTTLLQILLGELALQTGNVQIGGAVSYAAQEPWLFLATVRQNILFGQEYQRDLYRKVVKACCLERDFELFPEGDKTFVGERGVALSGGQRARINLARAVYRQADVYLFDDPFSAVDTRVGKQIFEDCIVGLLRGKTRVVVTHQVHLLEAADLIIVMNEGSIISQGKYSDVMQKQPHLISEIAETEDHPEVANPVRNRLNSSVSATSNLSTLVEAPDFEALNEETFETEQNSKIYWQYFRAGGNWCSLTMLVVVMVASQISCNVGDLWLSYWTQQSENGQQNPICTVYDNELTPHDNKTFYNTNDCNNNNNSIWSSPQIYIYIYTAIIIASIILTTTRSMLFLSIAMNAAKNLHNSMFESLVRAPMRFFDSNPSGRILNRFSRDMGAVDDLLPRVMLEAVQVLLVMTGILVMVLIANYYMIVAVVLLAITLAKLKTIYVTVAKNVKHLEGIAKSPIFSHFNASLNGLTTIRAAKAEDKLRKEFDKHQDAHTSAWFLTIACISSFGLWLDFICVMFIAIITFGFIVLSRTSAISGSLVGLALSQSLILTGMVQHGVRQFAEVVSQMTSVERIMEYVKIEKEAGFEISTSDKFAKQWPQCGKITFSEVSLFYNPMDPPVLKNLSFNIEAKQKVGIVGRTGAGKSSLIAALFHLTPFDGKITIDNVDTKTVQLSELRKKISIIPQEPVLFGASMRFNLDPFDEFEDEAIWNALQQVELKDSVSSLDFYVQEGGKNLSTGQRQLVCLARAILRNNKVLVLDEATANIDQATDSLIQATIRREFSDCTVLTIAHRLNTIMDSDKVLVMDAGNVAEFDHPFKLLQNTDGTFYKMVAQTGASVMADLIGVAAKSHERIINHSE